MALILDGKKYADEILNKTKEFIKKYELHPMLHVFSVGDNPASKVYVRNKKRACEKVGIDFEHTQIPNEIFNIDRDWVKRQIKKASDYSDGVIVQMPIGDIPSTFQNQVGQQLYEMISPESNVDGIFTKSYHNACTPQGCIDLLRHHDISLEGKTCVVVGRSEIVGKPLAELLLKANATVIQCHSRTPRDTMINMCQHVDIIFSAVGKPNVITPEMINPFTILVDIGINRNEAGKLCGDADPRCYNICMAYTPVPGGIGPMTVAELIKNTARASYYWTMKEWPKEWPKEEELI